MFLFFMGTDAGVAAGALLAVLGDDWARITGRQNSTAQHSAAEHSVEEDRMPK